MAKAHHSSITVAAADRFLSTAKERDTLACRANPGMLLMKTKKGASWRYRYTDKTGKRVLFAFGTYPQTKPTKAAEWVAQTIEEGGDPREQKRHKRQIDAQEAAQAGQRTLRRYLEVYYIPMMERSWKPRNAKANTDRFYKHFAHLLDRDMTTLTKTDMHDWQRQMEKKGRARATVKRTITSLRATLNQAVKDGVIEFHPLANFEMLKPTQADQEKILTDPERSKRRMLTPQEMQGLLTGLDLFAEEIRRQRRNSRAHGKPELPDLDQVNYPHWFIPFCHLALHTGLRVGDLVTLTWEQLNVRFGRLIKKPEKTAHVLRQGKIPAEVDIALNPTIKQIMTAWHIDNGRPISGLVFPSPVTGGEFDAQSHRKPWNHVKALGGLPDDLVFYALRHHFCSAMVAAGIPMLTIAKMMGHKSTQMIEKHYGHLSAEQAAKALDVVAATIAGAGKGSAGEVSK